MKLAGCHTTIIGGYVVEGHAPVETIDRLLAERPAIEGISLPGIHNGAPAISVGAITPEVLQARILPESQALCRVESVSRDRERVR